MLLIFSIKIQKHVADSDRPYPNEMNIATIVFNLKWIQNKGSLYPGTTNMSSIEVEYYTYHHARVQKTLRKKDYSKLKEVCNMIHPDYATQ